MRSEDDGITFILIKHKCSWENKFTFFQMEKEHINVEGIVIILNKGAELKRYNYRENYTFHEIRENVQSSFGIPIEKQVFYMKKGWQSFQSLNEMFKTSDSNTVEVHLAVKHSIGNGSQEFKIDPQFLNPFNVIFGFPETVVCKDLSLLTFSTTFDIKKYIEKEYKLPTDSQILSYNDKVLKDLYDLRELYYNNDEERFANEISINLKVMNEGCKISSKFINHATEHNLSSIIINTLTSQICINLAKEDIWSVLDIKNHIEKKKKIRVEAQKLMHDGKELQGSTWLPNLLRISMEKNLTLTLLVHQMPVEYKTFDLRLTSFNALLTGKCLLLLKVTETVRTLKEEISLATGIHRFFIKVYESDVLYEDDRLLFEIKGGEINFRLENLIPVYIVDENGVVHQHNHVVDKFNETVEDLRMQQEKTKRFTEGRKCLKFVETEVSGIKASDRLLSIDKNVGVRFHVVCEKFFKRISVFNK